MVARYSYKINLQSRFIGEYPSDQATGGPAIAPRSGQQAAQPDDRYRVCPALEGARVTEQRLEPGDEAPEFSLPDTDGRPVRLSALRGQQVIVYFYPAAMTPGCTKEACDFRDNLGVLTAAGLTVLGISKDAPGKLAKFRAKEGLNFPLLSDPGLEVHRAYGAYGEKTMYGKKTVGVIRSTFVIDPAGKVARAYYNVKATGHVERLLKDLAA
jgi:thioredoxin-dependent peroxiredoxin